MEAFLALGSVDDAAALASTAGDHDLVTYIEQLRLESRGVPWSQRSRCLLLTKLGNEALAMSELGTLLIDDPSNQGVAFQYGILVVNRKYQPGGYEWPDVVWRSR